MTLGAIVGLLLLYGLAAGGLVDLVKNGSIVRLYLEPRVVGRPLLAELLDCAFCQTYQAAGWLVLLFHLPSLVAPGWLAAAWQAPVVALAIARASWLINALAPPGARYDRPVM